jgi:hypothetical protein
VRPISIVLFTCYVLFLDAAVTGWDEIPPWLGLAVAIAAIVVATGAVIVARRRRAARRVIVCHVSTIEGTLRDELHALWSDEDHLWDRLGKQIARRGRAECQRKELVN